MKLALALALLAACSGGSHVEPRRDAGSAAGDCTKPAPHALDSIGKCGATPAAGSAALGPHRDPRCRDNPFAAGC